MNLCSEGYYKNRHSCFLIQYHLVLMTKYRHPVIQGELETRLKQYTMDYFKERDLPPFSVVVLGNFRRFLLVIFLFLFLHLDFSFIYSKFSMPFWGFFY